MRVKRRRRAITGHAWARQTGGAAALWAPRRAGHDPGSTSTARTRSNGVALAVRPISACSAMVAEHLESIRANRDERVVPSRGPPCGGDERARPTKSSKISTCREPGGSSAGRGQRLSRGHGAGRRRGHTVIWTISCTSSVQTPCVDLKSGCWARSRAGLGAAVGRQEKPV